MKELSKYFTSIVSELKFRFFKILFPAFWLLVCSSCGPDKSDSQRYYYSDEGLKKSITDTIATVKIEDKQALTAFLRNHTFISKTDKMVIDDSLKFTLFVNGRKESVSSCEITEYMVHNERLLLLTDSVTLKQKKYTVSKSGLITDMQTYTLFAP